ncbi:MAG: MFS transporter [Phycisphaeraceae bacterium]|nr:MFS transporter [Phycisphaeraceae bacterium]MCB9847456.1 MFS transporter [Phycisphaeraceae bacterium]
MSVTATEQVLEQPGIDNEPTDPAGAGAPTPPAPLTHAARRYWAVFLSHITIDLFPIFLVSLGPALKARLLLSDEQYAVFFAISPIISGLSQPLLSWISDKYNTRILGPLGLIVAALSICSIGFAQEFWHLIALQVIGMTGVGVYHPVGSAVAGRLSRAAMSRFGSARRARGIGLSIFFTGGMIGGFTGPFIASSINASPRLGMPWLLLVAAPAVLVGWAMWIAIRRVPHRSGRPVVEDHPEAAAAGAADLRRRWRAVWLLLAINSCRFTANVGLYFLFTKWAMLQIVGGGALRTLTQAEGDAASVLSSRLVSASTLGMTAAGLLAGWVIPAGREKKPFLWISLASAPFIALMPWVGWWPMLCCAFVAALGFFMPVPPAIGLAQRLLPHATGFTGSILMGCGWAISSLGPLGLGWLIARDHAMWLRQALGMNGIELGFGAVSLLLVAAGVLSLLLPNELLEATAHHEDT